MCTLSTHDHVCTDGASLDCVIHLVRNFHAQRESDNLQQWFENYACAHNHQEVSDDFARIMRYMLRNPENGKFKGTFKHFTQFTVELYPIDNHGLLFEAEYLINDRIPWKYIEPQLRMAKCPTGEHDSHIVFRLKERGGFFVKLHKSSNNKRKIVTGELIRDIIGCDGKIFEHESLR